MKDEREGDGGDTKEKEGDGVRMVPCTAEGGDGEWKSIAGGRMRESEGK